jgi:hypothetical protein
LPETQSEDTKFVSLYPSDIYCVLRTPSSKGVLGNTNSFPKGGQFRKYLVFRTQRSQKLDLAAIRALGAVHENAVQVVAVTSLVRPVARRLLHISVPFTSATAVRDRQSELNEFVLTIGDGMAAEVLIESSSSHDLATTSCRANTAISFTTFGVHDQNFQWLAIGTATSRTHRICRHLRRDARQACCETRPYIATKAASLLHSTGDAVAPRSPTSPTSARLPRGGPPVPACPHHLSL